ncbi:site-specific integrase [Methylobacterium sp. Leaf361]|uniref:tyrosine-type recombinase/integrase n=1 Tax=Methylobacterium sp. Leaf361 TaxID=1736352 RepID=UPI0018FE05A6|nr:site-specific integrase [Methylobacterium sp. Leaf361]
MLTDAQVRSLKADGASRLMIYDAKAQGLCLRVSASSKSWSFIYRPKGSAKQRRYTIGDYPSWSLAQAREKTFALRRTVQEGGDPVAAAQERIAALTVAGFIERYIERYAKKKLRSWRDYEGLLNRDVVPALGQRRAEELTRAEVANLLDKIAARAPVVSNRVLNTLSAVYSWGVSEGLVPSNPVTGLKRRHLEAPKERYLSDEEIVAFWNVTESAAPAYRDTFRLILLTGQRPGECAGIRAEEVDLATEIWTLPPSRTKNGRQHKIPLVGRALEIVRRLRADRSAGALIVSPRGRLITPQNLAKAFENLREGVFETNVTPHDLRRTAATLLGKLSVGRLTQGYVLNHVSTTKSSVTGSVYDQYDYISEKKIALRALDAQIIALIEGGEMASNVIALRV